MAKFVYRMQNILNIKVKMEVLEKQALALALAKEQEEEGKLEQLKVRKQNYQLEARRLLNETLSILEIQENNIAIYTIDKWIEQQKDMVLEAKKQVEVAREKLKLAVQEKKVYEKLREKAYANFTLEQMRTEHMETDEITSYRYCNNS